MSFHRDGSHCDRPADCAAQINDLTTHYRPGNGPNAPITCGVKRGCVTAVFDDVTCVECQMRVSARSAAHGPLMTPEQADRKRRAREAWLDDYDEPGEVVERQARALEIAIETAMRVRVDDEIIDAALNAVSAGRGARPRYENAVKAAFRAAGFEVEQ